jgi:tetratricopeptide (TPR) repeat protein
MMAAPMPANEHKTTIRALLPVLAAIAVGVLAASALVYWLLQSGKLSPVVLLILAALISLSLPMLRSTYFPSVRDCAVEYDFHDKRLAEQLRRQIADALGPETALRLAPGEGTPAAAAVAECRRLLARVPDGDRAELRFALLVVLSQHLEAEGDLESACESLTQALAIHPNHFLANFRLAAIREHQGDEEGARRHYLSALDDPGGLSRAMIKLTNARIAALGVTAA